MFVSKILGNHLPATILKLSELMGNGSGTMPLNSPGGSTMQWGAGRG